jgi:hypothetical protein
VHNKWKVAEKGFKMAFMMNKLAMINSCEIILEIFFWQNHCKIQVRTILVCTLYSIKYGLLHVTNALAFLHKGIKKFHD